MFGRQIKLPVDLMYGTTQGKDSSNGVREEFERWPFGGKRSC